MSGNTVKSPKIVGTLADQALSTTAALVAPEDQNRDSIIITNHDASIGIRVGDSEVTATRGPRVPAGQSITLFCGAAIYAVAESGAPSIGIGFTAVKG